MHPILTHIPQFHVFGHTFGPLPIFMYGFMLSVAFLLSISLTIWQARRAGFTADDVLDMAIYVIVFAIIMSRVAYIITNFTDYQGDPAAMMKIYEGGLSFHGGVIGGALAVILFCWRKKYFLWTMGDAIMPGLALGLATGRVGCFLNGCCYGRATDVRWGVVFPSLHDGGIHRHPTQLYDLIFNLIIMLLLIGPLKRVKRKDGDLVAFWLILSGITRFIMEAFRRGETTIPWWFGLTLGQWVCVAMIAGGILFFNLKWKKEGAPRAA